SRARPGRWHLRAVRRSGISESTERPGNLARFADRNLAGTLHDHDWQAALSRRNQFSRSSRAAPSLLPARRLPCGQRARAISRHRRHSPARNFPQRRSWHTSARRRTAILIVASKSASGEPVSIKPHSFSFAFSPSKRRVTLFIVGGWHDSFRFAPYALRCGDIFSRFHFGFRIHVRSRAKKEASGGVLSFEKGKISFLLEGKQIGH